MLILPMRTLMVTIAFFACSLPVTAQDKPNIVVIMVCNLGWGELGCYGGGVLRGAPTPRLDALLIFELVT